MRIGILGGTFNPIHLAHVNLAEKYMEELELDKIIFIPTYLPPHKKAKHLANGEDRIKMCELATSGNPRFEVSDFEVKQKDRSYTVRTLMHLKEQYPDSELFLIMGADMFLTVQNWRLPEEIFKMATLCAAQREVGELDLMEIHRHMLESRGAKTVLINMEPVSMSSTFVREAIANNEDVSGLLHPEVLKYIKSKKLYAKGR